MMRFQELVSTIIKSLKSQQVPPDELVSHIMTLGAFDPVIKKPQVPLFQHFLKELRKADTIPKVFLVLNDYFSSFNYDIVEHIIKVLGTKEDQDKLERYKEDFNQYVKRRVYEYLPQFGPWTHGTTTTLLQKSENFAINSVKFYVFHLEVCCGSVEWRRAAFCLHCRYPHLCSRLFFLCPGNKRRPWHLRL